MNPFAPSLLWGRIFSIMDDPLDSPLVPPELSQAVKYSPDNLPLLKHVAEIVMGKGGLIEAEQIYRKILSLDAGDIEARYGLASCFFQQGKSKESFVVIEALVAENQPLPAALLLHAKLAHAAGELTLAARQYCRATEGDSSLVDKDFESEFPFELSEFVAADSGEEEAPLERLPAGEISLDQSVEVERPSTNFDSVGGMEGVKDEIRMKIILPLQQPKLFETYGKKLGGGILMYGPPGCGKTFLARATAGEIESSFIAVGINDVLDMWIGQSEKNLHAIFENARGHKPCVLFFDEVDALGARRSDMIKSAGRQVINQFLSELDGVTANNDGVLVLAATNSPWHLDPAFRRPGRFDRIIFVPPPDLDGRAAILRLEISGKPVEEIDFGKIARKTEGFSGADLSGVVDLAVEEKLKAAMKSGKIEPLSTRDFLSAVKKARPSVSEWFSSAKNHALYANEGGLYDDILEHLGIRK